MSQDHKVIQMLHIKRLKTNQITDKEKIVYAYHYFESGNDFDAKKLLNSVSGPYYDGGLFKDISRALLCQTTVRTTGNADHGKESEFYLVVYRLTKHIIDNKLNFTKSSHFYLLKDQLFKDFM